MSKQKPWKVTTNTMLAVLAFRYDLIHTSHMHFISLHYFLHLKQILYSGR